MAREYCQRRWWHLTPVLLPGKSHGRRSLVGCSPWDCKESDTTERFHFHFSLSCIGEGNCNPLQCSCLENPRDGGVGGLPSMGLHRVRHDWSDLSAVAAAAVNIVKWWNSLQLQLQISCKSNQPVTPHWPLQLPIQLFYSTGYKPMHNSLQLLVQKGTASDKMATWETLVSPLMLRTPPRVTWLSHAFTVWPSQGQYKIM